MKKPDNYICAHGIRRIVYMTIIGLNVVDCGQLADYHKFIYH